MTAIKLLQTDDHGLSFRVYDHDFNFLGCCDFLNGWWYFLPAASHTSFIGSSCLDAVRSWQHIFGTYVPGAKLDF